MKPITRKEYYLAKAVGTYTGPTPPPVLREDYYLATLSGDYSGNCPAPVTRLDMFMSAAAGLTSYVPQPVTRVEKYWYAIAKGAGYVPEPVTREEHFLYEIITAGPKYIDKIAEGSLILLTDSAEAPLTALTVYGHSTQDGTPSPENPVPIVSAGDEGEIGVEVLGGNLADISQVVNLGGSSYVQISDTGFSFTFSEQEVNSRLNQIPCKLKKGKQYICTAERSSNYITIFLPEIEQYLGFGTAFTPNEDVNYITVYVNRGDPYDTYIVEHFMVNVGDTALSWEPYKTPQTMTLSTPGGLPGIPVTSGGNYTDADGQQWVCDEIDLARGKYVHKVGIIDSYMDELIDDPYISTTGQLSNGAMVYYILATPTETDLPAEEIASYKALHTYSPTTTVSNDAAAWMEVGYKATP